MGPLGYFSFDPISYFVATEVDQLSLDQNSQLMVLDDNVNSIVSIETQILDQRCCYMN